MWRDLQRLLIVSEGFRNRKVFGKHGAAEREMWALEYCGNYWGADQYDKGFQGFQILLMS